MEKSDTLNYITNKFSIVHNENTRMPLYIREFSRNDFGFLTKELGFTKGAEIGVAKGKFSSILCFGNPDMELYCIDPWEWTDPFTLEHWVLDSDFEETKKTLSNYNCTIIKKTSIDAIKYFGKDSLDFVYIDGDHHYNSVLSDIVEWSKIVRIGGIIAGHDYRKYKQQHSKNWGVIQAVIDYTNENKIFPWFIFGKTSSDTRCPDSFMWVKCE